MRLSCEPAVQRWPGPLSITHDAAGDAFPRLSPGTSTPPSQIYRNDPPDRAKESRPAPGVKIGHLSSVVEQRFRKP
jgi:hypothetical protein